MAVKVIMDHAGDTRHYFNTDDVGALSKAHHPTEAARVAAAALTTPAAVVDPWTMYVLPDIRFWPGINEQLRKAVER